MGLLTAPLQPTAAGETDEAVTAELTYQRWSHARQLRPRRPTDPLREKNISDNEVRQIEQATRAVFPTALGVGPALTIAAHALRVVDDLVGGASACA